MTRIQDSTANTRGKNKTVRNPYKPGFAFQSLLQEAQSLRNKKKVKNFNFNIASGKK